MRTFKQAAFSPLETSTQYVHPFDALKKAKRVMASMIAWLVGFLFLGLGIWILIMRFEGFIDQLWPHNMLIGQMTIDGQESKGHAELLRVRFDHHFRRPVAIAKETGFLEVLTLDTPGIFQQKNIEAPLKNMTVDVSGVDVGLIFRLMNQLAQPDRWVIEGDFQIKPDRALLALRMRRGQRLIRTWYLERFGDTKAEKSMLLEQLIDDAIFQLVYDFSNKVEQNEDLRKWSEVFPSVVEFPSRLALAAYYDGRGALGRYYAYGEWRDLEVAVDRLHTLRSQMPDYADGLKLLGMALAEQRKEEEAIHVYEQLELLLLSSDKMVEQLTPIEKRRLLTISLLKATARSKLYTPESTHQAIKDLLILYCQLGGEIDDDSLAPSGEDSNCTTNEQFSSKEKQEDLENYAVFAELRAQTAIQLAYAYAIYFSFLRHHTVLELFDNCNVDDELRVKSDEDREFLRCGPAEKAKPLVQAVMLKIKDKHEFWISKASQEQSKLQEHWQILSNSQRRQSELVARLNLAAGYGQYRMSELEDHQAGDTPVLGIPYQKRLDKAEEYLRLAEAAHPNHYLVLQFLALVYAEPRREIHNLSIAQQYIERAILASKSDYFSHALFAEILLRRAVNSGLGVGSFKLLERGLDEVEQAIELREFSGRSQLLRAQFLTLQIEQERDESKKQELRSNLNQSLGQARRFLPLVFKKPDAELTWLEIVAETRQLGLEAEALQGNMEKKLKFEKSKQSLNKKIDNLIDFCDLLEYRWVARQRVYLINLLKARAEALKVEISEADIDSWRDIRIQIF